MFVDFVSFKFLRTHTLIVLLFVMFISVGCYSIISTRTIPFPRVENMYSNDFMQVKEVYCINIVIKKQSKTFLNLLLPFSPELRVTAVTCSLTKLCKQRLQRC